MSANTLEIGGIAYGKINLGGQDYYQEKEPLGKGAFSEVYTLYPAKEDGSIDRDNPQALKVFKKVRGKAWRQTGSEVLQEAQKLRLMPGFHTAVYQLADNQTENYDLVEEQDTLANRPVAMLMPKFPGQPILSSTGEPHPGLARLTPLQRLELAALVVKTLMELPVDFTDLKPENILVDIQIDENGKASFGCYPIDFGGYGRTMMTAAPEWNGFDTQCDFFLVPELNEATLKELSITGNAIILDNHNNAHFVIAGKLDEKATIAGIDRQGFEPCEHVMQVQEPRSSQIIAEAAKKSHYGLGNHDKAMEVYSALSVLAPILGEINIYKYKKELKSHQTKEIRKAPFYLENMKSFLLAIIAKKIDPILAQGIRQLISSIEDMQKPIPEERPSYEEIYDTLMNAVSLLKSRSQVTKPIVSEDDDSCDELWEEDNVDSNGDSLRQSKSLPIDERSSGDSNNEFNPFTFFRSLSSLGSFSDLSNFSERSPFSSRSSTSRTPPQTPHLSHRKLGK